MVNGIGVVFSCYFWFFKTINKVMIIYNSIFVMFSFYTDWLPFNNIVPVVTATFTDLFRFFLFSWETNCAQWMQNTESLNEL